jgi:hypothetical protein
MTSQHFANVRCTHGLIVCELWHVGGQDGHDVEVRSDAEHHAIAASMPLRVEGPYGPLEHFQDVGHGWCTDPAHTGLVAPPWEVVKAKSKFVLQRDSDTPVRIQGTSPR